MNSVWWLESRLKKPGEKWEIDYDFGYFDSEEDALSRLEFPHGLSEYREYRAVEYVPRSVVDGLVEALTQVKSLLRRFNGKHNSCTIKYGYGPRPVDSRCELCKEYDAMVDRDEAALAAEKGRP